MTEAKWLASHDPLAMLSHLDAIRLSDRKRRLLICAFGRRAWEALNGGNRELIEEQERDPDRLAEKKGGLRPLMSKGDVRLAFSTALQARRSTLTTRIAADLLREIIGNPFRLVTTSETWMTADVLRLAQVAYDEQDFDPLPALADALEDAGCADPGLLTHLRSAGPHVRGCLALDVILGKS